MTDKTVQPEEHESICRLVRTAVPKCTHSLRAGVSAHCIDAVGGITTAELDAICNTLHKLISPELELNIAVLAGTGLILSVCRDAQSNTDRAKTCTRADRKQTSRKRKRVGQDCAALVDGAKVRLHESAQALLTPSRTESLANILSLLMGLCTAADARVVQRCSLCARKMHTDASEPAMCVLLALTAGVAIPVHAIRTACGSMWRDGVFRQPVKTLATNEGIEVLPDTDVYEKVSLPALQLALAVPADTDSRANAAS